MRAFTTANIVAIIQAARHGGKYDDLLARAGHPVSKSMLSGWLTKGRRDVDAGKETSYAAFFQMFKATWPGQSKGSEPERMAEIQQAMVVLGGSTPKPATLCECGNPKTRKALMCDGCKALDDNRQHAA